MGYQGFAPRGNMDLAQSIFFDRSAAASLFIDRRNLYAEADAVPARLKAEVNRSIRKWRAFRGGRRQSVANRPRAV
jgi:ABC-type sugar transport system ATPase subunit